MKDAPVVNQDQASNQSISRRDLVGRITVAGTLPAVVAVMSASTQVNALFISGTTTTGTTTTATTTTGSTTTTNTTTTATTTGTTTTHTSTTVDGMNPARRGEPYRPDDEEDGWTED